MTIFFLSKFEKAPSWSVLASQLGVYRENDLLGDWFPLYTYFQGEIKTKTP